MFQLLLNKISTHAAFSIFLAIVFAIMGLVIAAAADFSIAGVLISAFVFGAVVYLALDFYETFGDDYEQ